MSTPPSLSSSSTPLDASQLFLVGDLQLVQRNALANSGTRTVYNVSLIDATSLQASDYSFSQLLQQNADRNGAAGIGCCLGC